MEGQRALKAARVLAVGAGGLGSPLALYLAAAGVGTIGLVDFDVVDDSNLHRQILYGTSDVGPPEARGRGRAPARREPARPASCRTSTRLDLDNALEIFRGLRRRRRRHRQLPDALPRQRRLRPDGEAERVRVDLPFRGAGVGLLGGEGPCYRCLYAEPPPPGLVPSCAEGGVLGILPGPSRADPGDRDDQAAPRDRRAPVGRLLLVDALAMRFRELRSGRTRTCAVCGPHPTVTRLIDYEEFCGGPRPKSRRQVLSSAPMHDVPEITVEELKAKRDRGERFVLVDVREPHEWAVSAHLRLVKIPLGIARAEPRQAAPGGRDRRLLPERRAQRERRPVPRGTRLRRREEPRRRNQPVGGADRPLAAALLIPRAPDSHCSVAGRSERSPALGQRTYSVWAFRRMAIRRRPA